MRIVDHETRTVGGARAVTALLAALAITAPPFAGVARAVVPPGLVNPPDRPMQTQHAFKCQKLSNKGVATYLGKLSKTYLKCLGAIGTCVQAKADPNCIPKAAAACNASIPPLGEDDTTTPSQAGGVLEDAVTNFCGSLSPTEAFDDPGGPRFALLSDTCNNRFGFHIGFVQGYARCLFEETNCAAERMLLVEMPRARDLLATAGVTGVGHIVDPQNSCLTNENGSGSVGDLKVGKALLGCQNSAAKAGVGFASKARGALAKCADAVMNCAQLKPTQKCVDAAAKTCTKALAAVDAAQTKAEDGVTKACAKILPNDLFDSAGGDVSGLATVCNALGVSSLTTLDDYAMCLARQERCQVEDSIMFTVPRINEFLAAAGQSATLPSAFCPAP